MSSVELEPELIHAPAPIAQGTAGNSASSEAIRKLSLQMVNSKTALKSQRKTLERTKAALVAMQTGDFESAHRLALDALAMDKTSGLSWHVLAICQENRGEFHRALLAFENALKLLPTETSIAQDLGRLAQMMGHLEIAEKLFLKFLVTSPGDIEATNNLACVQREQKRYDEGIQTLQALISIVPDSPILWNTLGTILTDRGDMEGSLIFFEEALKYDPAYAKARYNRANARQPLGDFSGALEDLEAALPGADTPYEAATMKMARAMLLMGMGQIPEAFEAYEVRLDRHLPDSLRVVVDAPRWKPKTDDIRGKRLLIVGEQGIADEMLYGGCVGDVIEAVGPTGKVFLAVEGRLVDMFQRAHPAAVVGSHRTLKLEGRLTRYVPFVESVAATEGAIDAWIPIASLLAVFRPTIESFPDRDGYLAADPEKVSYWKAELEKLGAGVKVGLHWKSLVLKGLRARYFSSFERWRPVLTTPGAIMVNLQSGDVADDLAEAQAAGVRIWTPPINLKDDLEDVAALSVALDVVIGPGIAGTNLAAVVGANTWMITAPDDWQFLGTDSYPYYPRMRCYRMVAFNEWEEVMARLRADLDEVVRTGNAA